MTFDRSFHTKIPLFVKKRYFENKILHLLNVYQKSDKQKSKNIYENNVSIEKNVLKYMRLLRDLMKSIQIINKLR